MKKVLFFCFVVSFQLIFPENSDKRLLYWQMRENSLKQEMNSLKDSEIYPFVGDLLSNSILYTENLVKTISSGSSSEIDTEDYIDSYCRRSFDSIYLKKIAAGFSSASWNDKIKSYIMIDINSLSDADFGYHSDFYSANLINKIIDEKYKNQLLSEFFLLCMIENYEALYSQFRNSALSDMKHAADETNGGRFSVNIIRAETDRKAREFDIEARLEISKKIFDSAILSKEINYLVKKRFATIKDSSVFLKYINDAESLERGDYYLDKNAELEKVLFSVLPEKLYSAQTKKQSSLKTEGGITFSADADYVKYVSEVDRLRKENSSSEKFKKAVDDLSEKYFSSEASTYKKTAADEYARLSFLFISWKEKTRLDLIREFERYLMREEPVKKYISFIHEREKSAASLDSTSEGSKIYLVNKVKLRKAEDYFRSFFSVDKTDREFMTSADYDKIAVTAADFTMFMKKMQSITVSKNPVSKPGKNEFPYAATEISALVSMIEAEMKRYRELTYSADMINEYSAVFAKYEEAAKSGVLSDELKEFYEKKSLLPYVLNYDQKKINSETRARDYIAKMLNDDNVRIKQLSDYYARMGLCQRKNYDSDLKLLFNQVHIKKIGVFPITAKSISETDKKVSAYIIKVIDRKRWERGGTYDSSDAAIELPEFGLSVMIPSGWERREGDEFSVPFVNVSDGSELLVSCFKSEEKTSASIFDSWADKRRLRLVKSGGGKYSGKEFMSRVYESSNRKVVLSYCVDLNGKILIISGEVKKEKYQFFAPRIDSLFKSIKEK